MGDDIGRDEFSNVRDDIKDLRQQIRGDYEKSQIWQNGITEKLTRLQTCTELSIKQWDAMLVSIKASIEECETRLDALEVTQLKFKERAATWGILGGCVVAVLDRFGIWSIIIHKMKGGS